MGLGIRACLLSADAVVEDEAVTQGYLSPYGCTKPAKASWV